MSTPFMYVTSLAASGSVQMLDGEDLEFAEADGYIDVYAKVAAADEGKINIKRNKEEVVPDTQLMVEDGCPTSANWIAGFPVAAGDRIRAKLTETGGTNAVIPAIRFIFTPLGEQRPQQG